MRRNVIGAVLITILVLGALGAIGFGLYQVGLERGLVESGADVVVDRIGPHWGWGVGFFGFFFKALFFFLLIGLIARLFFGPRRWGWGPGPYGRRWDDEGPTTMEQRMTEWHDKAHGNEGSKPGSDQSA